MPTPWERDLVLARRRLTEWMQRMLPGASGLELSELVAPQSSGFSNETLLFSARWHDAGRQRTEKLDRFLRPLLIERILGFLEQLGGRSRLSQEGQKDESGHHALKESASPLGETRALPAGRARARGSA